ncbi:MAG: hypothetical protein K8R74_12450 [Bacteroidales bacterium]|nr:hypothetical protein [Bacteroidales bacterium]
MDSSVEIDPIIFWNEYVYLEDDFLKSIRYLPVIPEHSKVWSAHFADLIIRIGSVFDSFLKRAIFCESLNDEDGINKYRDKYHTPKKSITMKDYKDIFSSLYELPSQKLYILHTPEIITPFSNWAIENESLGWWKAYTNLKHDRFVTREVATLEETLNALGGLFLFNILHPETASLLVDYNIIQSAYSKECLKTIIHGEQKAGLEPIYSKTKLFGYVYKHSSHSYDDDGHNRFILSPTYPYS